MSRLPVAVLSLTLGTTLLGSGVASAQTPDAAPRAATHSAARTPAPVTHERRRSLPPKKVWLAKVRKKLAGAKTYLDEHRNDAARPALVLDIDNTSLATHYAWPKAMKPTLHVAQRAVADGYTVFFVTGRTPANADAARKPLTAAGYRYQDVLGRPQGAALAPSKQANRAKIVAEGYTVVMDIGNHKTDLWGEYVGHGIKLPSYHGLLS